MRKLEQTLRARRNPSVEFVAELLKGKNPCLV